MNAGGVTVARNHLEINMTQITCYDPQGVPHTVEAVDAREYIKSGHYTAEPPRAIATPTTLDAATDTAVAAAASSKAGKTAQK